MRRTRHFIIITSLAALLVASPFSWATAEDELITGIQKDTSALVGPPRQVVLAAERGLWAQAAIRRGDFARAGRIASEMLAESRIGAWRFQPFDDFIAAAIAPDDDAFAAGLNAWVTADPNPIALTLRAQYHVATAWARRGHGFGNQVGAARFADFRAYLAFAATDSDLAISRRDDNPFNHLIRMRSRSGLGDWPGVEMAFQAAMARFPDDYELYDYVLTLRAPKWDGSILRMEAFVDQYAGRAEPGAPIRMLYLALFGQILDTSANSCNRAGRSADLVWQCVDTATAPYMSKTFRDHIVDALRLYRKSRPRGIFARARYLFVSHRQDQRWRTVCWLCAATRGGRIGQRQPAAPRRGEPRQLCPRRALRHRLEQGSQL